ncbi:MAG: saccharopine dehydrogenase C-terminal domain-containing protein [Desulfurococcaceae archaeon]
MKSKSVLLVGVGKQGRAALWDLINSNVVSKVIAVDTVSSAEEYVRRLGSDKASFVNADLRDRTKILELAKEVDLIVYLGPAKYTHDMIRLAVEAGKHLVNANYLIPPDTSLDPVRYRALKENIDKLNSIAEEAGITVLPEFGLDPGIDLVLVGQAIRELSVVEELYTYGTGIPDHQAAATNPLKYKVTWTFEGVLNAYKRPARIIRESNIEVIPATEIFSKQYCHEEEFEGLGKLDVYPNGDAVEFAAIFNILGDLKHSARYSARWPGHCDFWKKLVDLHFLDEEPIRVDSASVSPRKFLAALLEPQLQLKEGERDIALVRVDARGVKGGKYARVVYQLLDYRDLETGFTAMQRTTGFTASVGAQMILRGDISKRGILFPGTDVPFDVLTAELEKRGMKITHIVEEQHR